MMATALNWKSSDYDRAKVLHKGTELATAIYGQFSRFQICDVRSYDADSRTYTGHVYSVRDAHTVNDAEVKAGVRPKVVASFEDLDAAIAYCDGFTVELEDDQCA